MSHFHMLIGVEGAGFMWDQLKPAQWQSNSLSRRFLLNCLFYISPSWFMDYVLGRFVPSQTLRALIRLVRVSSDWTWRRHKQKWPKKGRWKCCVSINLSQWMCEQQELLLDLTADVVHEDHCCQLRWSTEPHPEPEVCKQKARDWKYWTGLPQLDHIEDVTVNKRTVTV